MSWRLWAQCARPRHAPLVSNTCFSKRLASTSANPYPYPTTSNPTPHQIFHLPLSATKAEVRARCLYSAFCRSALLTDPCRLRARADIPPRLAREPAAAPENSPGALPGDHRRVRRPAREAAARRCAWGAGKAKSGLSRPQHRDVEGEAAAARGAERRRDGRAVEGPADAWRGRRGECFCGWSGRTG